MERVITTNSTVSLTEFLNLEFIVVSCSHVLLEKKRIEILRQYHLASQVLIETRQPLFSKFSNIISLSFRIVATVISNMQRLLNVAGQKEDRKEEDIITLGNKIQSYFDELLIQICRWLTTYLPECLANRSFYGYGWIYKWDPHEFEVSDTYKTIFR